MLGACKCLRDLLVYFHSWYQVNNGVVGQMSCPHCYVLLAVYPLLQEVLPTLPPCATLRHWPCAFSPCIRQTRGRELTNINNTESSASACHTIGHATQR